MTLATFPASGSTSWYAWATSVDSSMRASGPRGTRIKVVAAAAEPQSVKDMADYVCDGTSDQVEINAALTAVGALTINKGVNGGTVILMGRLFNIDGSILLTTQSQLIGAYGKGGTWIRRSGTWAPGNAVGMLHLSNPDVQYSTVKSLGLDGQGASVTGIYHSNDNAQEYDSYHTAEDLYIWNCGGDGISTVQISGDPNGNGRTRGNHYSQIRIINAGRYGVNVAGNDSFYDRVDAGSSGSDGFHVTTANNRIVNCKAWYSDGSGFAIAGVRGQYSACESQDNAQHGFTITAAHNALSACCADSNSYNGSSSGAMTGNNLYDGFNIGASCVVSGTSFDKNEGGRNVRQRYGVNITSATARVVVNVQTWQNASGSLNGTGHASSVRNVVDAP